MGSCAMGTCEPDCAFCNRLRRLFPPIVKCGKPLDNGLTCELVAKHPRWVKCRSEKKPTAEANPLRDGDPKLAAERERGSLAFRKRHREGPNYVPKTARV